MKPTARLFYLIAALCCCLATFAQPTHFQKINSGTRANIQLFIQSFDHRLFFLTDKIFRLENKSWSKLDLPVEGRITAFFPVAGNDIWFSTEQVNNTSVLYHFTNGKTEIIPTPFVNHISCIMFLDRQTAFFASFSDVAVFEAGAFRLLPPAPTRSGIIRIIPVSTTEFYCRTHEGELFHFRNGRYQLIVKNRISLDICTDNQCGFYLLTHGAISRLAGTNVRSRFMVSQSFRARRIAPLGNDSLIAVGELGSVYLYTGDHLVPVPVPCNENLQGVVIDHNKGVWIFGEKGRLLYSGQETFSPYIGENRGFSATKLIIYGISTDDEYGVAMQDFTGDGKPDIYAVRIFEQNRLYINNMKGNNLITAENGFFNEAAQRNALGAINPLKRNLYGELKLGISAADVDNDGDQDIYLCYLNSNNKLLLNKGDGYFRNVSGQENRACDDLHRSNSAAFADVDLDGDLDLFVTSEEGSNKLYENNGTGNFRDVTRTAGLASSGGGMCASFADIDADGLPDLCVTFWYPGNKLYKNISVPGKIRFRDITLQTDLADSPPAKSNGIAFADVNNDGAPDLFIANRNTGNRIYINNGKGIFRDSTLRWFLPANMMSNGVVFADFDLDGFPDLYLTNVGENAFYRNENGTRFTDVTARFGAELTGYCTGSATGDVDNDGDPDLYVANYINGNSKLFLNITECKTFVKLRLHGVRSNRNAIGAKIWLFREQENNGPRILAGYREVNGGNGYGSVSDLEQIFGVADGKTYHARIKFPCNADTLLIEGLHAGSNLDVYEMTGFNAFVIESGAAITRFFKDPETQPEIAKYLLILLILILYNLRYRNTVRRILLFRSGGSLLIFLIFISLNDYYLFSGISFTFFIAPLMALGLLLLMHLVIDRVLLRQLARKEKLELREKLSRDLHDDLASTLGSISIYANTLNGRSDVSENDFRRLSGKVAALTQSALQSISDIIWMTSPRNDSLQSLISKTGNYMFEILTDNQIGFENIVEIPDEPVILRENIRNEAFLILKEALHNVIRHANATHVIFSASVNDQECRICLKDNGVGIDLHTRAGMRNDLHGNGLENMRRRARESGMVLSIVSERNSGTQITLTFRI